MVVLVLFFFFPALFAAYLTFVGIMLVIGIIGGLLSALFGR